MDEEALVSALVSEGAQLETALAFRGNFPSMSPIVARDLDLNEWQLLFPVPREYSRLRFYETLQNELSRQDLTIPLDRILLVKDTDPGLRELRGSASPANVRRFWQGAPVEVGGRLFTEPLIVRIEPRDYENQVVNAIHMGMPSAKPMTPNELLGIEYHLNHAIRKLPIDYTLSFDGSIVLIETKALRRPLTQETVFTSFGVLSYIQRSISAPVYLVFVSLSGFTDRAAAAFEGIADVSLVSWQPQQGELPLAAAIESLVGPPPTR